MRRTRLLQIVSVFLMLAMLFSITGCNNNKGALEDSKGKETKEEVLEYPIVKDNSITLRYWQTIPAPAQPYIKSSAEIEVYQEMEKITGIKVEFLNPAGDANEQFNLMMSSGDVPDILQDAGRYPGGIQKGIEDGVFLDLTPNIQKYAPDYYKLLKSDKEIWRQNVYDGGRILSFNRVKPVPDPPYTRICTRMDWLEEAGMKEPKTIDEWEAYFKFIAGSKQGVAPYELTKDGMEDLFMGAFNILGGFYLKDGKKVDYGQIQPEFKEYLTLMNKWYQYGYIVKNFNNITAATALKDYGSGKTAAIVRDVGNVYTTAKSNNFKQAPTPFPRKNVNDTLHWYNGEWTNTGTPTVISSTSKYQTEAMKWLNYGYTQDGAILYNYGVKDRMWVMENGKPKYTDYAIKNPKYPIEAIGHIGRLHFGPKLTFDMESIVTVQADGEESRQNRIKWSDDKNIDNKFVLPPIKLSVEEADKRNSIMEEVNPYVNSMVIKFITGAEPLTKFDEFVVQIKKFGIDDAIKITQTAYERYMNQ